MDSNYIDKIQTNTGEFQVRDTTSYETSQQNKIDITKLQQLYVSLYNIVQQLVDTGMLDVSDWKDSFTKTNSSNIQPIYCDENGLPHKCDVDDMIIGTSKVTKKLENPINIVTNLETTNSVITDLSDNLIVPIQGVLPIENGGTGVNNQGDISKNIALTIDNSNNTLEDNELITFRSQNPTQKSSFYTKTVGKLWEYIKTKIQNVLGLTTTSYNGNVIGNLTGNVIGNLTGNVTGNVEGNATTSSKPTFTQIPINSNLDNYTTPGYFYAIDNTSYSNAPIQNFTLQVIQLMGGYVYQIIYAYSSNLIYTRSYIYSGGKTWTNWSQMVRYTDLSNYTSVYVGSSQPSSNEPAKLWVQI